MSCTRNTMAAFNTIMPPHAQTVSRWANNDNKHHYEHNNKHNCLWFITLGLIMWKYWTLDLCIIPYLKSQNSLNCLSTVCFVCMKHLFGVCSMLPSLPGLPCKIVFNLKQTFTWLNKGKKRKKKILPKWWCTHQHSFFNLMYSMLCCLTLLTG